jgi:predicted GNAT family N-acyltransferase
MLFVSVRRQGIAKALMTQAISKARSLDPELSKLIVHSSPYAVPIYQKMGFRKSGSVRTENGITYIPMERLF